MHPHKKNLYTYMLLSSTQRYRDAEVHREENYLASFSFNSDSSTTPCLRQVSFPFL